MPGNRACCEGGQMTDMTTVLTILSRFDGVRPNADGWMALCPAHADRTALFQSANRMARFCFSVTLVARLSQFAPLWELRCATSSLNTPRSRTLWPRTTTETRIEGCFSKWCASSRKVSASADPMATMTGFGICAASGAFSLQSAGCAQITVGLDSRRREGLRDGTKDGSYCDV